MAKIMLVEDDNNLREIYEARLLAEGYQIVSAKDGEEALALAVKERPDLIISDIMMPKISGFDMLDILRTTPETKDTKVIMMTALSQAEDKARADKLGADRYLVKSQVTLEDVAKVAREVLGGEGGTPAASPAPDPPTTPPPTDSPTSDTPASNSPTATPEPPAPDKTDTTQASKPTPVTINVAEEPVTPKEGPGADLKDPDDIAQSKADEEATVDKQIKSFVDQGTSSSAPAPVPAPEPIVPTVPTDNKTIDATNAATDKADKLAAMVNDIMNERKAPAAPTAAQSGQTPSSPSSSGSATPSSGSQKRVIQPINDITKSSGPNLDELMTKEEQKQPVSTPPVDSIITPGGGQVAAPVTKSDETPTATHQSGTVIQPGSGASSIAL